MSCIQIKRSWRSLACLASAVIGLLLFQFDAASAATLTTDKDDYSPGEVVYFLGTGFEPGEAVAITLAVHTLEGTILDYAVGGVYADAAGDIAATWLVPPEAAETTIEATAIGDQSGLIAQVTFTDHGPSPVSSSSFSLSSDSSYVVYISVLLGGGSSSVSLTEATAKIANQTASTSIDVVLTGPGGNGNGTWTGSFQGECATKYKLNNIAVTWRTDHDHNSTQTPSDTVSTTTANCPVPPPQCEVPNQAPEIVAYDLDLGSVIGCLVNGSFQTDANYTYTVHDTDGDPVTVTVTQVTGLPSSVADNGGGSALVTLVGPGCAFVTFRIEAMDDPSQRNEDKPECTPAIAKTSSREITVKARVIYDFAGFDSPLVMDTLGRTVKKGQTVPVKFRLYDCSGNEICDTPPNSICVAQVTNIATDGSVAIADSGSSNDNGEYFRYSGTCGVDGTWIFNLSTKTNYEVGKVYKITAVLSDGTTSPGAYVRIVK